MDVRLTEVNPSSSQSEGEQHSYNAMYGIAASKSTEDMSTGCGCFDAGNRARAWWKNKVNTSRSWRCLDFFLASVSLLVKIALFVFLLVRTNDLENRVHDLQDRLGDALDRANDMENRVFSLQDRLGDALDRTNDLENRVYNVQDRLGEAHRDVATALQSAARARTQAKGAVAQAKGAVAQAESALARAEGADREVARVSLSLNALGNLLPDNESVITVGPSGSSAEFTGPQGLNDALAYVSTFIFAREVMITVESGTYNSSTFEDFPSAANVVITGKRGTDSVMDFGSTARHGIAFETAGAPLLKDITLRIKGTGRWSLGNGNCIYAGMPSKMRIDNVKCDGWNSGVYLDAGVQAVVNRLTISRTKSTRAIYAATASQLFLKRLTYHQGADEPCWMKANVQGFIWATSIASGTTCSKSCGAHSTILASGRSGCGLK